MEKIDYVAEILKTWPRPHYLCEGVTYGVEGDVHTLRGKVIFPSSDSSIADRMLCETPHVNVASAQFGLWNAIHIIATQNNWTNPLALHGTFKSHIPILADREVDLYMEAGVMERTSRRIHANYRGVYSLKNKTLMELEGSGILTP